jgi:hypothetical protein
MDALIFVLRPAAFVICIAIFMYLVVDSYFYLAGRRKKV